MPRLPLARPGQFTDMNGVAVQFSEDDLAAAANAYNPALHEAPVVIGHPQHTAPAYGWVQSLEFGESGLVATAHNTVAEFAELVSGPYKKRSARFYTPGSPRNPVPGVYYLRDVGLLGAQPPAIKGLADVSFAEGDEDVIEVSFAEPDSTDTPTNAETDRPDPDPTPIEAPPMPEETLVVPTYDELAARESALAAREAELAAKESEMAKAAHVAFAESLSEKIHPSQRDAVVTLLCHLDPVHAAEVSFAEGDSPLEQFKALLNGLPKLIEFGEVAKAEDVELSEPVEASEQVRAILDRKFAQARN